jgi:divalent metal cation (Fe/Co/Zn/Cd) transporter
VTQPLMPRTAAPPSAHNRSHGVRRALRLVTFSVVFGLASGAVSVTAGMQDHSLGVFAVGLGVLADVAGSATLIWRFRADLTTPVLPGRRERQSAVVVSLALALTAIVLAAESAIALAQGSYPAASAVTLTAALVSLLVLTPLAIAKRRLGTEMQSRALQGDGALSGIGAIVSFLAITALISYRLLGWWWADRVTALIVAAVAGIEAWRTMPIRQHWRLRRVPDADRRELRADLSPGAGVVPADLARGAADRRTAGWQMQSHHDSACFRRERAGFVLSRCQDTELMAIGIGHDHPADLALADVDASCPEGDETVDLCLLITVGGRSKVEMQSSLPGLRHQPRTVPGDLRAAMRRADRGLQTLIPDQRPAQRFAPEVPDLP